MSNLTDSHRSRLVLRHVTSGDRYVADVDADTGEVYRAIGPVTYQDERVLLDLDSAWDSDPELVVELNDDAYVPAL